LRSDVDDLRAIRTGDYMRIGEKLERGAWGRRREMLKGDGADGGCFQPRWVHQLVQNRKERFPLGQGTTPQASLCKPHLSQSSVIFFVCGTC
jgi:hypothetical protein